MLGKKRKPFSKEWKENISLGCKKNGVGKWMSGKKGNSSSFKKGMSGDKSGHWKGGLTPTNKRIRNGAEFAEWRSKVFQRDNWTCQTCQARGVYLEAHHIKAFAHYPELRFDLENGVTLCRECHKLTDNYASKAKKTLEKNMASM